MQIFLDSFKENFLCKKGWMKFLKFRKFRNFDKTFHNFLDKNSFKNMNVLFFHGIFRIQKILSKIE